MNRTGIPYLDFCWNPCGYGCSNIVNCPTCWARRQAISGGPAAPAVRIDGDSLRVRFDRFDQAAYAMFLKVKRLPEYKLDFIPQGEAYEISAPARFAAMLGVAVPRVAATPLPLWPKLYDDQQAIVPMALAAKRFACWADCGVSGKTFIGAEFGRQVVHELRERVLIFTLNDIVPQWQEMVGEFYGGDLPLTRLESRAAMREWCATGRVDGKETPSRLAITNYEKLNHHDASDQVVSEMHHLGGVIADESDRLATGGGKQKWALIKSTKGVPYKLSLTATPAPNEIMEFASQASFLETMRSDNEIIWTFFRRDEKTHRWTVKKHARAAFFEFLAGWSIFVRDPRRYGWRLDAPAVPEPQIMEHILPMTPPQRKLLAAYHKGDDGSDALFRMNLLNTIQRAKLSQIAKGFVYEKGGQRRARPVASLKPAFVADLARQELAMGHQVLTWTVFDAETDILAAQMERLGMRRGGQYELLTGKTSPAERLEILERFRHGQIPNLISRATMLGYGMNFQHCRAMIFNGFTDSYKHFYQAWHRAVRPGQVHSVRIHIPYIEELEGDCWDNILRKGGQHEAAAAEMEANYIRARGRMTV